MVCNSLSKRLCLRPVIAVFEQERRFAYLCADCIEIVRPGSAIRAGHAVLVQHPPFIPHTSNLSERNFQIVAPSSRLLTYLASRLDVALSCGSGRMVSNPKATGETHGLRPQFATLPRGPFARTLGAERKKSIDDHQPTIARTKLGTLFIQSMNIACCSFFESNSNSRRFSVIARAR